MDFLLHWQFCYLCSVNKLSVTQSQFLWTRDTGGNLPSGIPDLTARAIYKHHSSGSDGVGLNWQSVMCFWPRRVRKGVWALPVRLASSASLGRWLTAEVQVGGSITVIMTSLTIRTSCCTCWLLKNFHTWKSAFLYIRRMTIFMNGERFSCTFLVTHFKIRQL